VLAPGERERDERRDRCEEGPGAGEQDLVRDRPRQPGGERRLDEVQARRAEPLDAVLPGQRAGPAIAGFAFT
jgi:hypothetical protein